MLDLLKKKQQKDLICGMDVKENFISKYGERFCSKACVKKYEEQNPISGGEYSAKYMQGCYHSISPKASYFDWRHKP